MTLVFKDYDQAGLDYEAALRDNGVTVEILRLEGCNHFTAGTKLGVPDSELVAAMRRQIGFDGVFYRRRYFGEEGEMGYKVVSSGRQPWTRWSEDMNRHTPPRDDRADRKDANGP